MGIFFYVFAYAKYIIKSIIWQLILGRYSTFQHPDQDAYQDAYLEDFNALFHVQQHTIHNISGPEIYNNPIMGDILQPPNKH